MRPLDVSTISHLNVVGKKSKAAKVAKPLLKNQNTSNWRDFLSTGKKKKKKKTKETIV